MDDLDPASAEIMASAHDPSLKQLKLLDNSKSDAVKDEIKCRMSDASTPTIIRSQTESLPSVLTWSKRRK